MTLQVNIGYGIHSETNLSAAARSIVSLGARRAQLVAAKLTSLFLPNKLYEVIHCNTQKYHLMKGIATEKTCLVLLMPQYRRIYLFEQVRVSVFKIVLCRLLSVLDPPPPFFFLCIISMTLRVGSLEKQS